MNFVLIVLALTLFSTGIFGSMIEGGFVPKLKGMWPLWQTALVCALAWFIPVLIMSKSVVISVIAGVTNALIPYLAWIYYDVIFPTRTIFIKLEVALPALVAFLVGFLLYLVYEKFIKEETTEKTPQ